MATNTDAFCKTSFTEHINFFANLKFVWESSTFHLCPNVARFSKIFLFERIRHLKKYIFEGGGFRFGKDEKMRRMWLGLGVVGVGLPPLSEYITEKPNNLNP